MMPFKLRSSHWIVDEDGDIVMGKGRMELLEHIASSGSINQAAKLMKMSYKAAWSKIKSTETHLGAKVVHTDRKTGTRLTTTGKRLLADYRRLKQTCMEADDRIFNDIFSGPNNSLPPE